MGEIRRYWRCGKIRSRLCVRWSIRNPLPCLRRWLRGRAYFCDRPDFFWRNYPRCGDCYCPTGYSSRLDVQAFGIGFSLDIIRDWTEKPCHCDKVIWAMYPDDYAEEIEEYGLDRLKAEYPDLVA